MCYFSCDFISFFSKNIFCCLFDSILDMFNLQSRNIRLLQDPVLASQESIDWGNVNQILAKKRKFSYLYIDTNILR